MHARQYLVAGNHAVHGHAPGSTFSAELDAWTEKVLVEAGHLRVVDGPKDSKEKTPDEE